MVESVTNTKVIPDLRVVRRWVGKSEIWLNSFLALLPSKPNIVAVIVMGSAVRDQCHRRSDFDLVVLYRGKRPDFNAPLEVDIRAYRVEDAEEKLADGHEIIGWAMKYGTAVYDEEGFWHKLRLSWADRIPLPKASEAAARGQTSLASARQMLEAEDDSAADDLILAALTQFVREKLIAHGVFPASRPELPSQLRSVSKNDPLAQLLEDAMYSDCGASVLVNELESFLQAR